MHVMHIVHWPKSGVGIFVYNLVRELVRKGVVITVVLLVYDAHTINRFKEVGCEVISTHDEKYNLFELLFEVKNKSLTNKPSIVHVHSILPHIIAFLLFRNEVKYVYTVHSNYPYFYSLKIKDFLKRKIQSLLIYITSSSVVAISRVVQNAALSALGCTVERLIYNGVVFNSLYKNINPRSSDKPFGLRLVSVGRLDKHKCMDKLIMAVSLLKSDITNIHLQIIGDGEQKSLLQSMIKQLDLEKHVELLGWQEEPGLYLHQCDLYVCVSSFEGFGLALVEAMLSNLPVLTTKVGIAIEIIKDEDNGFFIENCEPSIIAKKIKYINKCHDLAFRVARKGHELAKNNFEITKCADNYMNLYLLKMVEYNE